MQMYRLHTNHAGHGYNAQKSWETTLYRWSQRQRKKKKLSAWFKLGEEEINGNIYRFPNTTNGFEIFLQHYLHPIDLYYIFHAQSRLIICQSRVFTLPYYKVEVLQYRH